MVESIGTFAWDPRLERFGWYRPIAGVAWDFGVFPKVMSDDEIAGMMINIEHAQLVERPTDDAACIHGVDITVSADQRSIQISVPFRCAIGCFIAPSPETTIVHGLGAGVYKPEGATAPFGEGVFSFHIIHLDTGQMMRYSFRTGFRKEEITLRRALRKAG